MAWGKELGLGSARAAVRALGRDPEAEPVAVCIVRGARSFRQHCCGRSSQPTRWRRYARRSRGSVLLEVVVQRDGTPRDIRVFQSLDPKGLDLEAVRAVERWRFSPGRVKGVPVDVLVTIALDFSIR